MNVVILTGAGVSAESGIKTFRAADGLWEDHHVEDVATHEAFIRDPELVQNFYNQRSAHLLNGIEPNDGHRALADFEQRCRGNFTLVTQNIDNLHERSGSKNVLHMHGELLKIRCDTTGDIYPREGDLTTAEHCSCCNVSGKLRPHVVWFGEMPFYMDEIEQALTACDLFVSIGTSGNVYPAAGFYQTAKAYGAHTVELNLEPTTSGSNFDEQHYGPASQLLPRYFGALSNES